MAEDLIVRPANSTDVAALAAIYGHHVLHGLGTFELTPPDAAWMDARRAEIQAMGLPYLVAERAGRVLGYAYASQFRPRPGYRFTVEDSVYVSPDAIGQGIGKVVLAKVISACETMGMRQIVAVIGDSGNAASIGLHRALGFQHAGVGQGFGFKHGRWVDVVWMQKPINGGASIPPD